MTVVASLVVNCCAIKKNVIVASQFYDVADVQFTVEKENRLELLQFIQKYNLGNSVPNIVIMLRIFLTIAVSVSTCERSFSNLKLIKNYLRSSAGLWQRGTCIISRAPGPGAELRGCQGGPLTPKILPGPPSGSPKIFRVTSCHCIEII